MSEITYDDKIDLNVESTIANINKVTASDMNEIKSVVNANANTLDNINVPSNWVKVGDTIPTDGRKVLFKASKNLLDMSQVQIGKAWNGDANSARAVVYMKCYPNTNYTISYNNISTFDGMYWVEKTNATDTNTTYGPSQITDTRTITTKATSHYIVIQFAKTSISLNDFNGVNIQIEQGSSATTYEPYIEQDLIVNGGKFIADQLVSVGATNSNDGRRVWFGKSKNLLPYIGFITQTINDVTITNNNNGTFTINGTATGDISYPVYDTFIPMSGTWRLVGCPSGGSSTTYMLSAYVGYWGGSSPNIDTGSGTNITYTGNVKIRFYIKSGTHCNNLIFKPMLTYDTSATYDTFEPYVDEGIYVDNELYGDNYSYGEQVIGKWVDGKKIYRKTYQVTNISSNNVDLVDVSSLNFDTIIKLYGFVRSQAGMCMPMPLTDSASNYNVLFLSVNKIRGRVVFGTGGSVKDCFVTIEYTKT